MNPLATLYGLRYLEQGHARGKPSSGRHPRSYGDAAGIPANDIFICVCAPVSRRRCISFRS